jgi:hypothetical protein
MTPSGSGERILVDELENGPMGEVVEVTYSTP